MKMKCYEVEWEISVSGTRRVWAYSESDARREVEEETSFLDLLDTVDARVTTGNVERVESEDHDGPDGCAEAKKIRENG